MLMLSRRAALSGANGAGCALIFGGSAQAAEPDALVFHGQMLALASAPTARRPS